MPKATTRKPAIAPGKKRAAPAKKVVDFQEDIEEEEYELGASQSSSEGAPATSAAEMQQWLSMAQASEAKESQKRGAAIKRKIAQLADEAFTELDDLNTRSKSDLASFEDTIAQLKADEQPEDEWKDVFHALAQSVRDIHNLIQDQGDILELHGSQCDEFYDDYVKTLDHNPTLLRKSRKKIGRTVQQHLQANTENQKIALDSKEMIKRLKVFFK